MNRPTTIRPRLRPTTIPQRPTTIQARPTTLPKHPELEDPSYHPAMQAAYSMIHSGVACVYRLESGEYKAMLFEQWKQERLGRCVMSCQKIRAGMEVSDNPKNFSKRG